MDNTRKIRDEISQSYEKKKKPYKYQTPSVFVPTTILMEKHISECEQC